MQSESSVYEKPLSNLDLPDKFECIKYFKGWIIFFLLTTLIGALLGGVLGVAMGAILGSLGVSLLTIQAASGIAGFVVGIPISFFSFKWAVRKYIVSQIG